MKNFYFVVFGLFLFVKICYSQEDTIKIYLIPGQGSDYRIFEKIKPKGSFDTVYIHYPNVRECKKCDLGEYAELIAKQIDTTERFILVGVSLGGMISSELTEKINPELTILLSSAKCRDELAVRYRFQKYIPLYWIFPKRLIKWGSYVMQPLVEPDRKNNKDTFVAMLKAKDPKFLKQTIRMVTHWDKKNYNDKIVHIHGNIDKTIPIRNVKPDYIIENGSHMMSLTRGDEINSLIEKILEEKYINE